MNRFLLLAALAGIALAMTACGPATPTTTAGTGAGAGAGGGSGEPPAAPTPTPDPDPPPAPPEPDKRWDLDADHFGDDDATIWTQTSNRSAPFAWDRITAANRDAVTVSVGGQPLPIDNLSYEPAFASDLSGAEWRLAAEVTEGAVVLVLTAENQRRTTDRVASITLTSGGTGYTSAPLVELVGSHPDIVEATATATAADQVASVTITNGGNGYVETDTRLSPISPIYDITFSGGNPRFNATATVRALATTVGGVTLGGTNSGYTSVPTITFSTGAGNPGTGATAVAVGPTGLRTIAFANGGSGYTGDTTVTCPTPTGGRAATGTGHVTSGAVTSVTVTDPGLGYTSAQICTFGSPQSGTGAQATGTLTGTVVEDSVTSVTITHPGVGYTSPPDCGITGTATCTSDYGTGMWPDSLVVTNPGSGYLTVPTVEFPEPQDANGIRAQGTAVLTDKVTSITLTDGGSGYRRDPTVDISGGGGNGATAVAKLAVSGYTEFDNLYWARQTLYGKELVIEIAEEETGS